MPTVFIALQCCQCSTVQVKQQKKRNNKWTCVVCNEKQSVREVHAQGFMAKDVRLFVQNFNMSRQLAEQIILQFDEQEETLGTYDRVACKGKQKRTDWSEYVDPDEDSSNALYSDENNGCAGDELEPHIITELPKPLLKKPKLKSYRIANGYADDDDDNGTSPLGKLGRKYYRNHSSCHVAESTGYRNAMFTGARLERVDNAAERKHAGILERKKPVQQIFEWKGCFIRDGEKRFAGDLPRRIQASKGKEQSGSKSSCYMTEEDEGGDLVLGRGKDVRTRADELSHQNAHETGLMDQMVDEEIHPDFL